MQTILTDAVATVIEGDFEWDDEKAQSNLEKHGVSFAEAATVFADPAAVYLDDGSRPTGWSLSEPRCAIESSTLFMWSEAVAIASSARGRQLVPNETFTNPERPMTQSAKRGTGPEPEIEPVRVLGRGLRAARGIHLTLRTLRDAAGKTQIDIAKQSQMNQGDISRLETRSDFEDCQVATLRRYVEALGGSLELVAQFGDKKIAIAGIQAQPTGRPDKKALQQTGRKPARR